MKHEDERMYLIIKPKICGLITLFGDCARRYGKLTIMDDIRSLIPRDKHDVARAEAAVAASYPAVEPIILELVDWTSDINWPVARILLPFIDSIHQHLVPHAQQIMDTGDEKQKYWLIAVVFSEWDDIAVIFRDELQRIAYSPTERENAEKLPEVAQDTLKYNGWLKTH